MNFENRHKMGRWLTPLFFSLMAFLTCSVVGICAGAAPVSITLTTPAASRPVKMGQTIIVTALAKSEGRPLAGQELWAYLNGRRWGASGVTNAHGRAKFMLALPNPGSDSIEVIPSQDHHELTPIPASWIWAGPPQDNQTVYFTKSFSVPATAPDATLYITCDDNFEAFLNGHHVATGTNWGEVQEVKLNRWLKAGSNELSVRGYNGGGPAGLLAALQLATADGVKTIVSDASWHVNTQRPAGWPAPATVEGTEATVEAEVGGGAWGKGIENWPGLTEVFYPVDQPIPGGVTPSNTLMIRVAFRRITVPRDPKHMVGMDWEPWFTRQGGARWDTAEAVPVLGKYNSDDPDVTRQHILWMDDMGIDFLVSDWSNNLGGGQQTWDNYPVASNGMIQNTTKLLDLLAQMRDEGVPVPQVTLLLGIGAPAALNGEIKYVEDTYIANPRYHGLWVQLDGKPLIEILSVRVQTDIAKWPKIDPNGYFTIRWEWTDLTRHPEGRTGWWSWMEMVMDPAVAYHDGRPEAMTITPAYFDDGGWLKPGTVARRNGATYVHQIEDALKAKPEFVQIIQWNEFLASANKQGGGPNHDIYFDVYNGPLSDDIEPTTPYIAGYRGDYGWGFKYLNLTRAMVRIYRGLAPESTLLALATPSEGQSVSGAKLHVAWSAAGKPVSSYTILLDGKPVASGIHGESFDLPLGAVAAGRHKLTLRANGAVTRFPLSETEVDRDYASPRPVLASAEFRKTAG